MSSYSILDYFVKAGAGLAMIGVFAVVMSFLGQALKVRNQYGGISQAGRQAIETLFWAVLILGGLLLSRQAFALVFDWEAWQSASVFRILKNFWLDIFLIPLIIMSGIAYKRCQYSEDAGVDELALSHLGFWDRLCSRALLKIAQVTE